jgi:hypothetical protein
VLMNNATERTHTHTHTMLHVVLAGAPIALHYSGCSIAKFSGFKASVKMLEIAMLFAHVLANSIPDYVS